MLNPPRQWQASASPSPDSSPLQRAGSSNSGRDSVDRRPHEVRFRQLLRFGPLAAADESSCVITHNRLVTGQALVDCHLTDKWAWVQVIAFAELHKVRGVTDLRRAIIQAEKNQSLPRIVQQAR